MQPSSTAPDDVPVARLARARTARRLFFVVLCLLLVAAAAGLLGVRTGQAEARSGAYRLSVRYPSATRPGLSAAVEIEIRRQGGFSSPVTIAVDSSYLDAFDLDEPEPHPTAATSDGERLIWTFAPPADGDTLEVSIDGRVQPGVQLVRAAGSVAVVDEGSVAASVQFHTLVLP